MQSPGFTEEQVGGALERILARPEFQPPEPGRLASWFREVREAFLSLLRSLFEKLEIGEWGDLAFTWVFRVCLVLVATLLVVHLVRVMRGVHRGRLRASVALSPGDPQGGESTVDWAAAAEMAAREGRFRDAVLALYQALLERLHRKGLVRYDDAKTPGDYRREIRADRGLARAFDGFLSLFEPIAFGGRESDLRTFERLHGMAREMAGD